MGINGCIFVVAQLYEKKAISESEQVLTLNPNLNPNLNPKDTSGHL